MFSRKMDVGQIAKLFAIVYLKLISEIFIVLSLYWVNVYAKQK